MAENPENFQERLYNISNLNIWFAISSLIFLAVLLWSFVDDYSNDWKDYQREFRNLQVEKTNEELKIASSVFEGSKKYNELQSKLKTFNEKLKQKSSEIANVDKIDMSESPAEETFGITKDMDEKEKCKLLRKEFTKWNNQTTNKDPKRRKRAKEMIKIVAELRKKYDC